MVSEKDIKCPSMNSSDRPKISDYWTKKDKAHNKYCKNQDVWTCSNAEGCKWEWDDKLGGDCMLNSEPHLGNVYINGGIGFGKLCLDNNFTRLIVLIIYPPLYIYIMEREFIKRDNDKSSDNKKRPKGIDIKAIIMCFVYTCAFYFPGLVYALYYHFTKGRTMGCLLG